MKRANLVLAFLALAAAAAPGYAASDVNAAGQGTGSITFPAITAAGNVTCSATVTVAFIVNSNNALLTEDWGSGSPTGPDCSAVLPAGGQYQGENEVPELQECLTTPAPAPLPSHIDASIIPAYTLTQSSNVYVLKGVLKSCDGKMTLTDAVTITVRTTQLLYSHLQTTTTKTGTTTNVKATATLSRLV